jgi:hypothetical protein
MYYLSKLQVYIKPVHSPTELNLGPNLLLQAGPNLLPSIITAAMVPHVAKSLQRRECEVTGKLKWSDLSELLSILWHYKASVYHRQRQE